jgi:hypothetical protein
MNGLFADLVGHRQASTLLLAALEQQQSPDPELEAFRRQLEGLL